MEVGQGPNWGYSAKEKKVMEGSGCGLIRGIILAFAWKD
jgi:hypothetical protein